MVNGKAKLITDSYCDGLGACLGECPVGAIEIIEREGDEYNGVGNPETAQGHNHQHHHQGHHHGTGMPEKLGCGCPGSSVKNLGLEKPQQSVKPRKGGISIASSLVNWPVQLMLIPPNAPYLQNADLLIAADCVAYAKGDFHLDLLPDKVLTIACPKLDNAQHYIEKLTQIISINNINSIEVAYMEVPCCSGLVQIVRQAIANSGKNIPLELTKISLNGERI
jgi:ferredoxin